MWSALDSTETGKGSHSNALMPGGKLFGFSWLAKPLNVSPPTKTPAYIKGKDRAILLRKIVCFNCLERKHERNELIFFDRKYYPHNELHSKSIRFMPQVVKKRA